MTVPTFNQEEFLALLKKNGWDVVSDLYWEEFKRVVLQKNGVNFPLQLKAVYGYPIVVKTCLSLGIDPPEDHYRVYKQYEAYKEMKAKELAEEIERIKQEQEKKQKDIE